MNNVFTLSGCSHSTLAAVTPGPESILATSLGRSLTPRDSYFQFTLQVVLVRVFGTETGLVDRNRELETCLAASGLHLSPQPLVLFGNGRIECFLLDFISLNGVRMKLPDVSRQVAECMSEFHFKMVRQWSCVLELIFYPKMRVNSHREVLQHYLEFFCCRTRKDLSC